MPVPIVIEPVLANDIVGEVVELPVHVRAVLLITKLAPALKFVALALPVVVKAVALTTPVNNPPESRA